MLKRQHHKRWFADTLIDKIKNIILEILTSRVLKNYSKGSNPLFYRSLRTFGEFTSLQNALMQRLQGEMKRYHVATTDN